MGYDLEALKRQFAQANEYYERCEVELDEAIVALDASVSVEQKQAAIARVRSAKAVLTSAAKHFKQAYDILFSADFANQKGV